jgi:hypothetical protein
MKRSFTDCCSQYCSGHQIKKNERMGGRQERREVHTGFGGEDLSKTDHLQYLEDNTTLNIQEEGLN